MYGGEMILEQFLWQIRERVSSFLTADQHYIKATQRIQC